jgi:hypothetical protein
LALGSGKFSYEIHVMYRRFLRLIGLLALFPSCEVLAEELGVDGPGFILPPGISIGMDRRALRNLRPDLRALEPALNFGPMLAEFVDSGADWLGVPGILYFQIDPDSGRLRQLLFEWRDARVSNGRAAEMLTRLEARLGPPELSCFVAVAREAPRRISALWRGTSVVLRVSMFDHRSADIAYFDPNTDSDPRRPSFERRRITRRSLPRRLVARVHDIDDSDLKPRLECPHGSSPQDR